MSFEEQARFVRHVVPDEATFRSALLESAANGRDLPVERLGNMKVLVRLPGGLVPFLDLNGPDTSHVARWLSQRKERLRAHLHRGGLPVPATSSFGVNQRARAFEYAETLGWRVRVSASGNAGAWAASRTAGSEQEFGQAWRRTAQRAQQGRENRVVVEELLPGEVFEFFVVDDRIAAIVSRPCVGVTGDGHATVDDLVQFERARRADHPYLRDIPLAENLDAQRMQSETALAMTDVPAVDETIRLRTGRGDCAGREIATFDGDIDPGFERLVLAAIRSMPGMAYGGVAVIAPDIRPGTFADGNHTISGVDHTPAPLAHFPTQGEPKDVAGAIVDHYLTAGRWEAARSTPFVVTGQ